MKRDSSILVRALIVLALILALGMGAAAAESYEAGTMRLLRYEGDVEIFDVSGRSRFVMENVRFASGEAMQTGEKGLASVSLDDAKIVTLDARSRVEFIQEADHLQLNLAAGTLFLDVTEKLDENESLDIQTTTMTVGIRGTIVFVTQLPADPMGGLPGETLLGVLEGTAQIDYMDESGAHRRLDVPAGKLVTVPAAESGRMGVSPEMRSMTRADIEGFVLSQITGDRVRRVREGSEEGPGLLNEGAETGTADPDTKPDYSSGGTWTWIDTVTLVAQSASKIYDGTPLTRPSDVLVYSLPEDFTIQVSADGSQTDAGEGDNLIARYVIRNAQGEDVTEHFTNVEKISGVLRVDPAPLIAWTGSAQKNYNGQPLTCGEAELKTAPGYAAGDPLWRNTSLVTRTALGSETMISLCGCTWVHGANPLTGETREIVLHTGERLTVCLCSGDAGDSIGFQIEKLTEETLPDEALRLYADNPALLAQACQDAEWDIGIIEERIGLLPETEEKTVIRSGVRVPESAADDVMTDSADVRITIDTEITDYNARPLTGAEIRFAPIALDPSIVISATGSRTEAGESTNTYEITWGDAQKSNYVIGEDLGVLRVLPGHKGRVDKMEAPTKKVFLRRQYGADGWYP